MSSEVMRVIQSSWPLYSPVNDSVAPSAPPFSPKEVNALDRAGQTACAESADQGQVQTAKRAQSDQHTLIIKIFLSCFSTLRREFVYWVAGSAEPRLIEARREVEQLRAERTSVLVQRDAAQKQAIALREQAVRASSATAAEAERQKSVALAVQQQLNLTLLQNLAYLQTHSAEKRQHIDHLEQANQALVGQITHLEGENAELQEKIRVLMDLCAQKDARLAILEQAQSMS